MSPELFDPEKFGLKDDRQTKRSDCYALGMVIYEVLSGKVPFSHHVDYTVVVRVTNGERPGRPQREGRKWFTDDVWSILERCWEANPGDRPRIKDVLLCLEKVSRSWTPPSPQIVANSSTTNPSTLNSDASTEESTEEGGVSSHSDVSSSQPSQELSLRGDPNEDSICPSAHEFLALPQGDSEYQHYETSPGNPSKQDPEEPIGVLDMVSWTKVLDGFRY